MSRLNGLRLTDDPKKFMLRVRLDRKTLAMLEECSIANRLTKSAIVRRGIEEQYNKIKK